MVSASSISNCAGVSVSLIACPSNGGLIRLLDKPCRSQQAFISLLSGVCLLILDCPANFKLIWSLFWVLTRARGFFVRPASAGSARSPAPGEAPSGLGSSTQRPDRLRRQAGPQARASPASWTDTFGNDALPGGLFRGGGSITNAVVSPIILIFKWMSSKWNG